MSRYAHKPFACTRPPELRGAKGEHHPIIIVGAGPVGLAAAIAARFASMAGQRIAEAFARATGRR